MDELEAEFKRLLAAKDRRRRKLAALSWPEKVQIVVRLQEIAAPVLTGRGRSVRVWNIAGVKREASP